MLNTDRRMVCVALLAQDCSPCRLKTIKPNQSPPRAGFFLSGAGARFPKSSYIRPYIEEAKAQNKKPCYRFDSRVSCARAG